MARPPVHGTVSTYCNHHCRCDLCKEAQAAYTREYRARQRAAAAPPAAHGTNSAYIKWSCRCDLCKAAHAAYQRDYRRRTPPPAAPARDRPPQARAKEMPTSAHGTPNGYTYWRCRCWPCTSAQRVYIREYRRRQRSLAGQAAAGEELRQHEEQQAQPHGQVVPGLGTGRGSQAQEHRDPQEDQGHHEADDR